MKVIKLNTNNKNLIINKAIDALNQDGLIIYPTETCYGLGADATNPKAVQKVFKFKGFRQNKPISIAVSGIKMAEKYAEINQTAKNIYQNLLPGPVTVVSKSKGKVAKILEAKTKTIGVRVPDHQLVLDLLKKFEQPITATSANVSGGKTPYTISDILSDLSDKKKELLGLVIDAGKLPKRPPSSVVDTTLNEITVLRQGEINFDQLKTKTKITKTADQTIDLGKEITLSSKPRLDNECLIFALQGELGAGKTQFAKGIARGLEINQPITSPTFSLIKEYSHQHGIFYHIDAWRINQESFQQLNLGQYIQPGNVIAVEWIQKGKSEIDKWRENPLVKLILVEINHLGKETRRINYSIN